VKNLGLVMSVSAVWNYTAPTDGILLNDVLSICTKIKQFQFFLKSNKNNSLHSGCLNFCIAEFFVY
jgi:hypothetical protein